MTRNRQKIYSKGKLFSKIYRVLFISFLITILVQIYFGVAIYQNQQQQLIATGNLMIASVENLIGSELDSIRHVVRAMAFDSTIASYVSSKDISQKFQMKKNMDSMLSIIEGCNPNIYNIILYDGDEIYELKGNSGKNIPGALREVNEILKTKDVHYNLSFIEDGAINYMLLTMPFYAREEEYGVAYRKKGTVAFQIDMKQIEQILAKASYYDGILIELIDANSNSHYMGDTRGRLPASGDKAYYSVNASIDTYNMNLVIYIPKSINKTQTHFFITWVLVIFIVFAADSIVYTYILHTEIISPIGQLVKQLSEVRIYARSQKVTLSKDNEINLIAKEINTMIDKNKEQMQQIVSTQARLYEAELCNKETQAYALQLQINPHFLYNTLQCIRSMALANKIPEIADTVSSIAKILRYSTNIRQIVTVEEEKRLIEEYLHVCRVRFEFNYILDFEEGIEQYRTMKMVLQPLVENAIDHGLKPRAEIELCSAKDLTVTVCAYMQNGNLVFEVRDTGCRMTKETADSLNQRLNVQCELLQTGKHTESIGLSNVNGRIQCQYGDEYGVSIFLDREETGIKVIQPLVS